MFPQLSGERWITRQLTTAERRGRGRRVVKEEEREAINAAMNEKNKNRGRRDWKNEVMKEKKRKVKIKAIILFWETESLHAVLKSWQEADPLTLRGFFSKGPQFELPPSYVCIVPSISHSRYDFSFNFTQTHCNQNSMSLKVMEVKKLSGDSSFDCASLHCSLKPKYAFWQGIRE